MKTIRLILYLLLAISIILCGCAQKAETNNATLLTTNDLTNISVSAAEGSGSIRTLTIRYMHDGSEESAALADVKRIDLEGYDDDNGREQTFTASDCDGDGIFDIIVYREFWFPDIDMPHAGVPEWPAIYEYDTEKGFVIASSKYTDYFEAYVKASNKQLSEGEASMDDDAKLALKRLIYAAEQIADGSFTPEGSYNGFYYEDVYELTKDINE